MGLIVNRPLASAKVAVLLQALGMQPDEGAQEITEIYFGGPIQPGLGFVLHSPDYELEQTAKISDEVYLTTNLEIIHDIQEGQGPDEFRFTLGYAGWGPEQLEREIANGDWLVIPANAEVIFNKPDVAKWTDAARQFGIEISQFSGFGGSA